MAEMARTAAGVRILCFTALLASPPAAAQPAVTAADFAPVTAIAAREIAAGHIPGAVILIGNDREDLYRQAFGQSVLGANPKPMTADTIFDLASMTKPVATTIAVLQLAEAGKLDLDAPAARYWPRFAAHGKATITLRQLLTHYSGLPPDLDLSHDWQGYDTAMAMLVAARPLSPPGTSYAYGDLNFLVLGELVCRVSGQPLDRYCREHISSPWACVTRAISPRLPCITASRPPKTVRVMFTGAMCMMPQRG